MRAVVEINEDEDTSAGATRARPERSEGSGRPSAPVGVQGDPDPVQELSEVPPIGVSPARSPARAPWWLSDRVLGLVLLGIVLAMIYVVLAASGVV